MAYCPSCAHEVSDQAAACPSCGHPIHADDDRPSWIVTLLLAWFFGVFGFHHFYLGNVAFGVVYLFTLGFCGLGVLIDLVMILTGSMRDSKGRPLRR